MDVGDLLHLQRPLQSDGVVGVSSDEEHGGAAVVLLCQSGNGGIHVQRRLHLLGQAAKRREQALVFLPIDSPQRLGRV